MRVSVLLIAAVIILNPWFTDCHAQEPAIPAESAAAAAARHTRVSERRQRVAILCHRGASEFAHENTLEAYRATFELGGDGNEIDIRQTKDSKLVCFHDDMLDRLLDAYGDVSNHNWNELQSFAFRNPGPFGEACRIPTLLEVLQLHREHGRLMHLDIKRPGLDEAIAELLTQMDMWDHVAYVNMDHAGVVLKDPRLQLRRYKAGLYEDRGEVFPDAIAAALKKSGDDVICDDPRGVAVALGRKLGPVGTEPVSSKPAIKPVPERAPIDQQSAIVRLNSNVVSESIELKESPTKQALWIVERARSADSLAVNHASSAAAFTALETCVRNRSLHPDWLFHGLDGASAVRALIALKAPQAVEVCRFVLWRDDPTLDSVRDQRWNNPRSWTDFRIKSVAFPALEHLPGPRTEQLCHDYLALGDDEARRIGPEQFEAAAKTLLAVSPKTATALELMRHRLQVVRGRAVLSCLSRASEPWAIAALEQGAPHALAYRVHVGDDATNAK